MKVIYPLENGGVAVVNPTGLLPIEQVALKDVPAGVPFLFVEDEEVPADRSLRDAWTADFSEPDGYGIGADAWFAQQQEVNE